MTSAFVITSGALFLFEASMGLFYPTIYQLVDPRVRVERPAVLPMVGSLLGLWGVACLVSSIPPTRFADWFLVAVGIACVQKASRMIVWPDSLHDTPDYIRKHPTAWRVRCVIRGLIGVVVVTWGTMMCLEAVS